VSADISELLDYALQLDNAVSDATPKLSKMVERGANNIKRDARAILSGYSRRGHLKHYPRSFGYDMITPLEAEVGPEADKKQGGMGRGVEFGSVHTKPMPHWMPAADLEEPRFGKGAADILWKAMR
jgi:hypothetical protein